MNDAFQQWQPVLASSNIWDDEIRDNISKQKASERDLNHGRSLALVPGTGLQPKETDIRVPILLLQRNCMAVDPSKLTRKEMLEFVSGWDIIIPKGWGMAFWKCFIFAGARVAESERAKKQAKYDRTPKAKRPSFEKLQVASPFAPAFDYLTTGRLPITTSVADKAGGGESGKRKTKATKRGKETGKAPTVVTSTDKGDDADGDVQMEDVDQLKQSLTPLVVISGPRAVRILESLLSDRGPVANPLAEALQRLSSGRFVGNGLPGLVVSAFDNALVRVHVSLMNRGVVGNSGIVYAASEEEYSFWCGKKAGNLMGKKPTRAGIELEEADMAKMLDKIPPENMVIGYITTGGFALGQGKAHAIGCCTISGLKKVLDDARQ
ncbi:hypothetical protein HDV00_010474 [Rhizophlyctis rosea]|nr:hypothetical protein HDV00_010474 [Rhizophlyctis rosea]